MFRIILSLVLCAIMTSSLWSLELVQNKPSNAGNNASQAPEVNLREGVEKDIIRRVGMDIENLISRGDIRVSYEWLNGKQKWNYIVAGHVNPHPKHKAETGTVGVLAGGRLYLQERNKKVFTEMKIGVNIEDQEGVFASELGIGYVIDWRKDITYEVGLNLNRSYGSVNDELKVYLNLNLVIGYPYKVFGF